MSVLFQFKKFVELTNAELTSEEQTFISECAAQEGATDADVEAVLTMEIPTTKAEKCLNACIGEKTGVVSTIGVM